MRGIGNLFTGPLDVDLGPKNVYQPDVVVVLNAHFDRIAAKKIIGTPDLVVEVASPSTAAYDQLTKYDTYARSGVAEDAIAKVVVRRGTRPDIPDAVGKNLEGDSWIVVLTWSGNTKGTRACTKSVGALKMFKSR